MAQRVEIQFLDDLDGGKADTTVKFGVDGIQYEIDLSAKNADELTSALAPYIEVARRVGGSSRRRANGAVRSRPDLSAVRAWARSQGLQISDRGRIPGEVLSRYEAAH
jgi:hypothetical protein